MSDKPKSAEETPLMQIEKLQAFKDFVHRRLDESGIPTHPEGEHSKAGCRIGDRLDIVDAAIKENAALKAAYKEAVEALENMARLTGYQAHPHINKVITQYEQNK